MVRQRRLDGLFQKGVSPTPEMRAKQRAGLIHYHRENSETARQLKEFHAKIQAMIDECYRRMKLQ